MSVIRSSEPDNRQYMFYCTEEERIIGFVYGVKLPNESIIITFMISPAPISVTLRFAVTFVRVPLVTAFAGTDFTGLRYGENRFPKRK